MSRLTSYPITIDGEDIYFTTAVGTQYQIYLTDGSGYLNEISFGHLVKMIGFRPLNETVESAYTPDSRLHVTIITGITLCFERAPDLVLVYVCDMMDGRQRQRSLLFDRWFDEFGGGYQKRTHTDNAYTYCGLIYRDEHPQADELDEVVADYIDAKSPE